MRVLMFGWEFPPYISGGLGTACFGLAQGLLKQGTEVIFVVPKSARDENGLIIPANQPGQPSLTQLVDASDVTLDLKNTNYRKVWKNMTYLEVGLNLIPYLSPEQYAKFAEEAEESQEKFESTIFSERFNFTGSYGANLLEEVSRYGLVAAKIAGLYEFDVIHVHDWLTFPAGIIAKHISGKPLVVHVHATEFDRSGKNINPDVFELEQKGMESADHIIAVSNFTKNIIIEKYGIPASKITTVHNAVLPFEGTERRKHRRYLKEKIVTFLGRITFQKGPEYFIEAAYKILQTDKNVRFVMAGSGDLLHKMVKRVAELRISSHFHFTGFLVGNEVEQMFDVSDVYVMPSVSEPFGISPLEAMRSNVPVIISKQSGVAEVLTHALKVDFWDVNGLADAIYGLLHYKALPQTFIKLGKTEVDNLQWINAAGKVNQIYNEIFE